MGSVDAVAINAGTVDTARLGSGTANSSTFLRGDQTWATPPGGGGSGDVTGDDTSTTVQNIVAYSTTGGKNITELTGTQGDVLYHDGTKWAKLPAGTSGHVLKTNGAGANPSWGTVTGAGDVVGPSSSTDNAIVRFDSTTGKLVQNSGITIDDSDNLAGTGWERSVRTILEERPGTPSTYDDEFDATSMDAKWTFFAGSSSNLTFSRSRILSNGTVHCTQSISGLTHPLRVRAGFRGNANAIAQGCNVIVQGLTKWLYFGLDVPVANQRRAVIKRYSNAGVYEADLATSGYAANISSGAQAPLVIVVTLIIDSTNINMYLGPIGSEALFGTVARSVCGTLDKLAIQIVANWSCDWFRVDRATSPYDFPLAWAG